MRVFFVFVFMRGGLRGGGGGTRASEFFYKESKSKNLFLLRIQIENKKYRVFGGGGGGGERGGGRGSGRLELVNLFLLRIHI